MSALVDTFVAAASASLPGDPNFQGPVYNPKIASVINYANGKASAGVTQYVSQKAPKKFNNANVVVLYSGGLYSYMLVCQQLALGKTVFPVEVLSGSPACGAGADLQGAWSYPEVDTGASRDFDALRRANPSCKLVTPRYARLPSDRRLPPGTLLPIYIAMAADVASKVGAPAILTGHHAFNYDARINREMGAILSDHYGDKINVASPFLDKRPNVVLKDHVDGLGLSMFTLENETQSCESSPVRSRHCGKCWPCYSRWRIFQEQGRDLVGYCTCPWDGPDFEKFSERWGKLLKK